MQFNGLHKNIYRLYTWSRTQECLDAYREKYHEQVTKWQKLRSEGVSTEVCQEVVGISRATYYRHLKILKDLERGISPPSKKPKNCNKPQWGEAESQLVLTIRRAEVSRSYGKEKIGRVLRRDYGLQISDSTVGRIIKHLKAKGLLVKSISAVRDKRKRNFQSAHAKRWTFKAHKKIKLGERVQIDHMTVTKNGITLKHFQAWDRKSKYVYASVFSNATSLCAKRFLEELIEACPFEIRSIQVDGGSEFMGKFEEACREKGIPLLVLPPSKPTYNGGVERANRIFREEFYSRADLLAESVGEFKFELKKAVNIYNTYRPHRSLKGYTPMEYLQNHIIDASKVSHIP